MNEGVCFHEIIYDKKGSPVDYLITDCNPAYESIIGLKRHEVIGQKASEVYGAGEPPYLSTYAKVAETGEQTYFETYFPPFDKYFKISAISPEKGKFVTIFNDITEYKNLKDDLQRTINEFNYLFDSMEDALFVGDLEGNILDVNETAVKRLGYSKQELLSMNIKDIDELYDEDGINDNILNLPENGKQKFESVHITNNGTRIPVEINSNLIKYKEKTAVLSVVRNITDRKNAEKLIQRKIQEQKALLSSTPAYVYLKDSKLNYLTANDAFCKVVGFSIENIKGKNDFDFLPEKEAEKYRSDDTSVMESRKPIYNLEEKYTTSEGEIRWALTSKVPYFDTEGNVIGIVGSSLDITERKRMYEKLERAEYEKRALLNSTSEIVVYHDLEGKILWCNKAATKFTGLNCRDMIGQYCYKLLYNKSEICDNCPIYEIVKTGKHYEETVTFTNKILNVKKDPVRNTSGDIIGIITVTNDITDRVKTEEKIEKYAEELEKINIELEHRVRKQTEDIINAERTRELELHHRIKNNLQVISSLLSLQSEKFTDDEVKDAFIDTQNRVKSMSLVHNKLYQTKGLENVNSKDYIEDLVDHLVGLYGGSNITIKIDVQDIYFGIDTIIPLGMIITELLSNSLKYAFFDDEQGEVYIGLYRNEEGNYKLIVADNGKGFSEDIDIEEPNTLGLQLVNSLVDQINGDFEAETINGTKFVIEFNN
ncbi:signal transduction histidine kinase [Methanohalobium evestigatum Z-7303]|uniref:Signal transduction histidine kinase n=1 Tax=Methanohalobium evestigatum (strain ATCC BAA-1072 / DSM 3721 / NBRC 107634 / OCM 161 / Z-7303) TaxID=644295 RepID=D7E826_METEZ|nr:PAS domain S-box protein [Methanohalobium evestigatum]ADI73368.1 signal transduction histidine kinase [Methanohalobium evestigatum Z-7303]